MWRLVVLFVMSIYGVRLCYGQQFTDDLKTMMTYLPRTADDFHSKYYDTDLEYGNCVKECPEGYYESEDGKSCYDVCPEQFYYKASEKIKKCVSDCKSK